VPHEKAVEASAEIIFNPLSGYILAAAGSVLFSSKAIFIKLAYGEGSVPDIDAITLLALRMAFALPVYLAVGLLAWRGLVRQAKPLPGGGQLATAFAIGVLGYYLASYLDFEGLVYLTAQFERLLLFTYPFFVMLLGALFFGGRVTRWGVIALILSYMGISVIFFEGATAKTDNSVFGAALVIGAAFCFALYQLLAKPVIAKVTSPVFTCVAMTGAGVAVIVHFLGQSSFTVFADLPGRIVLLGALLAVFATVLPSFMLNAALGRVGPQAVSIIGTLSPVATIVLAIIFLNEPFTPTDAIGTALVIAGVGLFTWRDSRKKAPAGTSGT
jgi:drug/metabolite transporter (DMT)-like permease